ncbi:MAG: hypothetical protein A3I89_00470 [Candidatus Harrisonbacteria bacterium RIFCSPLOWO2_02_FULL_41_11]|uniref:Uncharacterized protein n=1 Tax=Candidatus Harrisonbacteria bacterium RIFCSPHIGHO2_02_FULL_42_16 TaxID=1798404 RepID=A0A1G1ZH77_9BACT|nr:MAG: hypothetical protein A3B92_02280 [Candidatus Harrisonbacteria bacterium RIFCSPHIGHO2_02_FULL_42_16]OGY66473.1 MAG: hypothetical protein A3I89_00470 [Candidatus Harrisonbacteria bacterium RIFCSPLOWO2_02_FULL_41_11]
MKKAIMLVLLAIGLVIKPIVAADYSVGKTDMAAVTSFTQTAVNWPDYKKDCEITDGGDYEAFVSIDREAIDNRITGIIMILGKFVKYSCAEVNNSRLVVREVMVLGNKPMLRYLETESEIKWDLLDVQFFYKGKWTSVGLKRLPIIIVSLMSPKRYLKTGVLLGVVMRADSVDDSHQLKVTLRNLEKRP